MNKKLIILSTILAGIFLPVHSNALNPALFTINVQFPKVISRIPDAAMYYCGYIIESQVEDDQKKITFNIMEDRRQSHFYFLIVKDFQYEKGEGNTIKYLKIDPALPYKFYTLELMILDNNPPQYRWDIIERKVPFANGRIPDNTIILCYDPSLVETMAGGSAIELPTVVIKPNILDIVGSEAKLHEKSTGLLLSCLDYNAIHARIDQTVKHDLHAKTIQTIIT